MSVIFIEFFHKYASSLSFVCIAGDIMMFRDVNIVEL